MEEKKCSKCGQMLPVDGFYKNKKIKSGYYPHCKKCHKGMVIGAQKKRKAKEIERLKEEQEQTL